MLSFSSTSFLYFALSHADHSLSISDHAIYYLSPTKTVEIDSIHDYCAWLFIYFGKVTTK